MLLNQDKIDESITELQASVKKSIVSLYKQLLLYQMKSVCLYGRSVPAVLVRDLVKLDDWKGQVASIQKAAESVKTNVSQFRDEDMSSRLRSLDWCLRGVRTDLQALTIAVQDLSIEQQNRHDDDKDRAFLNDLYSLDPKLEKAAIEDLKGGLVREAHDLVFEQSNFEKLQKDTKDGIIWITGGPGRGKTMFLCGVINQLLQQPQYHMVAYFFCRADRQKTRTAKSVLRGLLWLICDQSWGITRRLRKEYENQSKRLFEDDDVMVSLALEKMLAKVLSEPSMEQATLFIDAIDECDSDSIRILIKAIGRLSRDHPAQWILSSRTSTNYRSLLSVAAPGISPSYLELSDDIVSSAVQAFVKHKINELSMAKGYSENLRNDIHQTLSSKASDTFLWVALVCLELDGLGIEPRHVKHTLETMPKGLSGLYKLMLAGALDSVDGSLCREILPLVCIASRPLTLDELRALVPRLGELSDWELRGVVANCGSFLSVLGNESSSATLSFIHESAREYLTEDAQHTIFPLGIPHQHRLILNQALKNFKELKRNIYSLPSIGSSLNEIGPLVPDPLSRLRYSCLHWLDHASHLQEQQGWQTSEDKLIESFICKDLLHWLEALSLTENMPQGTAAFQRLSKFYRSSAGPESQEVSKLVEDAHRFILYNKACIETTPLQVYASAILFCPQRSMSEIRRHYQHELDWVALHPEPVGAAWPHLIHELPSEDSPECMAYSPDGRFLVTGNSKHNLESNTIEHSVEIWDVLASHHIKSIHLDDFIEKVAFSSDGCEVVVVLSNTVQRLEADSGRCLGAFTHPSGVEAAFFSPGSRFLALKTFGGSLVIHGVGTGEIVQSIDDVISLSFSPDDLQVATRLRGSMIALWRIGREDYVWKAPINGICTAFFGNDQVAVRCGDATITLRATTDGSEIRTIPCHPGIWSITWLGAGLGYMCWCDDQKIKVFDDTGTICVLSLPNPDQHPPSMEHEGYRYAFSAATHSLAWVGDPGIRLWDLNMRTWPDSTDEDSLDTYSELGPQLAFSPNTCDDTLLASWSPSNVTIWTVHLGKVAKLHTLPFSWRPDLIFSPNGKKLMAWDISGVLQVWDTASGSAYSERRFPRLLGDPCISADGEILALVLGFKGVRIWDFVQDLTEKISQPADQVTFSHDGKRLAIACHGHIEVWTVHSPDRLFTLDVDIGPPERWIGDAFISISFSPDDESLVVATRCAVHVWPVGDTDPRWQFPRPFEGYKSWHSMIPALSPDGNFVAVAADCHVWIWHLGQPVTSRPLHVKLPHTTKKCRFDVDSTRVLIDGGAIDLPPRACLADDSWAETQDKVVFHGYALSEDFVWIMKDNQRVLYLPRKFRPRRHPKTSWPDKVAFMDSTVAIATESGRIHFLRFHDDSVAEDSRW